MKDRQFKKAFYQFRLLSELFDRKPNKYIINIQQKYAECNPESLDEYKYDTRKIQGGVK